MSENPYLGDKSKYHRPWELPVLIVCGILLAAGVSVTIDYIHSKPEDLWVAITMDALFAWPVVSIICHRLRKRLAEKYARVFSVITAEKLPLEKLHAATRDSRVDRRAQKLLDKGYLRGFFIDRANNEAVFTEVSQPVQEEAFVEIECPRCGAKNRVRVGRVGRCAFCDGELLAKKK